MRTYVSHVDVPEGEYQNTQELAAIWGEVRGEVEELGGQLRESYALLGRDDFLVIFTVPDTETAFQVADAIERHGLDTECTEAIPTHRLGEIVTDT